MFRCVSCDMCVVFSASGLHFCRWTCGDFCWWGSSYVV